MSFLNDDPIAIQAFNELMISCEVSDSCEDFELCFEKPVSDPVEDWAVEMALAARKAGWYVDGEGRVVCPSYSSK